MKESVAVAKEADAKKGVSPAKDNSIYRARNEPERQLGSLRGVIGNIRRDGGTPSVESIATELSGVHAGERAPVLLALQQTHGNWYVQRVVAGIQAKLVVGQPGDVYEQEADRVADAVMRMSELQIQRQEKEEQEEEILQTKPLVDQITPVIQRHVEEEEEEMLQAKSREDATPHIQCFSGQSNRQKDAALGSVDQALAGPGRPLEPTLRQDMEQRFGYDFSRVQVHTDRRAALAAGIVNARAFTVGQDIVFGSGQYSADTTTGKKLLAHELTHTIQQHSGLTGLVVQRTVIDDVREKLSYGFADWAINDSDAMEALALLGAIPDADLVAQLQHLGDRYITRLLDNLPDAARAGEVYRRVLEAIGAGRAVEHATEQLSYGVFDWAITDREVTRVFNTLVNLPAPQQEVLLGQLNDHGRLGRLISNSTAAHYSLYIRPWIASLGPGVLTLRQRGILRTIVTETPDTEIDTLRLATEKRFRVTVGRTTIPGRTQVDWDPSLMRQAYLVLDELPEAHVAENRELLRFGQFREAAAGGRMTTGLYASTQHELAINVEAPDVRGTATHETGHAVDQVIGWSTGPEPATPERGGWQVYGAGYNNCATGMVADSNGAIQTTITPAQRGNVINEMATAMGNRSVVGMEARIRNLPWFTGLLAADRTSVIEDRALAALGIGLNTPWYAAANGGEHLRDHVYQEAYENWWVQYRHTARARKVSRYQFRGPRDWFAEAYRFYYMPDPRGRGAKLADHDPNTKTYFDTHVHTIAGTR